MTALPQKRAKHSPRSNFNSSETMETMASIYKKKPFFMLQFWWDTKTVLPEVYKLQSNDLRNNYKAKSHKDNGQLGIKFTLDKTILEFIHALEKLNLDYVTSVAKFGNTRPTGSKCSTSTFQSRLTQKRQAGQDCALAEKFLHVINLFLICTLNKKKQVLPVQLHGKQWGPWRPQEAPHKPSGPSPLLQGDALHCKASTHGRSSSTQCRSTG
jgi:hypothetical protein